MECVKKESSDTLDNCKADKEDKMDKQASDRSLPNIPESDMDCCESENNESSEASLPLDLSSKTSVSQDSITDSEEVKKNAPQKKESVVGMKECVVDLSSSIVNINNEIQGNSSQKKEIVDGMKECIVDLSSSMVNINNEIQKKLFVESKETKKEKFGSSKSTKKNTKQRIPAPRRSTRNKNKQKTYTENKSDSEIEEIAIRDPLASLPRGKDKQKTRSHKNNTIVVKDTKRLAELASGSKNLSGGRKEPTLIIIDTQSILNGKGPVPLAQAYTNLSSSVSTPGYSVIPISLPAKGVLLPLRLNNGQTSITASESVPTQVDSTAVQTPPITQLLPSMTDDMHIVEAPSFIVPYLYLKPSEKSLKHYVDKLKPEAEKQERKNSSDTSHEKKQYSDCSNNSNSEKTVQEENIASNNGECDKYKPEITNLIKENVSETDKTDCNSKEGGKTGNEKSINDETILKTLLNSEESDKKGAEFSEDKESIQLEVELKEESCKIDTNKQSENVKCDVKNGKITPPEQDKKSDTKKTKSGNSPQDKKDKMCVKHEETLKYFETPLGMFFMNIGLNLVQEHVQTDALRTQKRKRDREGAIVNTSADLLINAIVKNLEICKEVNEPFHFEQKKCEYCGFKTESSLVMAQHLETPHMRNYVYKCNFCSLQIRSPHDILFHMESEHCVRGRLERAPALHQCPNCTFEDTQKSKLTRHILVCLKRYKPEKNLEPPLDWAPPAKILRSTPKRPIWGLGSQSKSKKTVHSLLPKLAPGPARSKLEECLTRGRGRPSISSSVCPQEKKSVPRSIAPSPIIQSVNRVGTSSSQSQILLPLAYQISNSSGLGHSSFTSTASKLLSKNPHVSITPLPKLSQGSSSLASPPMKSSDRSHGRPTNPPTSFVVCEICDGYIKDLEQLRNHMQWIHKVKIHPKMIHNRPPLNCQKCQSRFFTDQGLERHLLGTHGLVTSSMQDASNHGRDNGRCPICGRIYNCKLLNHVNKDHNLSLRPAHLSYKCTVCTATFEMYKDFEHHVYSVHSAVAKRAAAAEKHENQIARALATETLLRPLKINDEVTVIPHASSSRPSPSTVGSAAKTPKKRSRKRPTPKKVQVRPMKEVQVIDIGDSPDEEDKVGRDSDDEVLEMVRKKFSKKAFEERLDKLISEEALVEKRARLVTEEDSCLESEDNLKKHKELCADETELKTERDHERDLQILERLCKSVPVGSMCENREEKLDVLKQLSENVSEDANKDSHKDKCFENIKNLLAGEGILDGNKCQVEAGSESSDALKQLTKDESTDTGLLSQDGDKEDSSKKRAKKGKSPRKKSSLSNESV